MIDLVALALTRLIDRGELRSMSLGLWHHRVVDLANIDDIGV